MKYPTLIFILLALLILTNCSKEHRTDKKYVVMVSLDGFRWDYPDKANTPMLDSLAKEGVKAEGLIPSFPTKTFPNHYSLATGLYPDHHGIVQNSFYDPATDRLYAIRDRKAVTDSAFYKGEPIWVTAEKQGIKSASFYWVGSEAPIKGIYPTYWKTYNHDFPFELRIDTVAYWLSLPVEKRPGLILLYFHEPDHIGHVFGPDSDSIVKTVEYLDGLVGTLCQKINALDIKEHINLIVLSDHGMGYVHPDSLVILENYIDTTWFEVIEGWNPNFTFKVKEGYYDLAYSALSEIPNVQVWKHGEVPEALHYGNNQRTLDFILVADNGYAVMPFAGRKASTGAHGYDNRWNDMHAIFYASGPEFKKGYTGKRFSNIHIYSLIAEILDLAPAKTDGSADSIRQFLQD